MRCVLLSMVSFTAGPKPAWVVAFKFFFSADDDVAHPSRPPLSPPPPPPPPPSLTQAPNSTWDWHDASTIPADANGTVWAAELALFRAALLSWAQGQIDSTCGARGRDWQCAGLVALLDLEFNQFDRTWLRSLYLAAWSESAVSQRLPVARTDDGPYNAATVTLSIWQRFWTSSRPFLSFAPPPRAPCATLYLVPTLIGWCLVLGIRWCDQFGASGTVNFGIPF